MRMFKTALGAGALATLAAVGLMGGVASAAGPRQLPVQARAQAQTPNTQPRPVHLVGRVDSVSGASLVLSVSKNKSVTVNTTSNTWILAPDGSGHCAEGTVSKLQTGKPAEVLGMTTAITGTVDAKAVAQGACVRALNGKAGKVNGNGNANGDNLAKLAEHLAAGTIKTINGSTLTLTTDKGKDLTVNTTADTVVFSNGFSSVSNLKVGDKIQVFGKPEAKASGNNGNTNAGRVVTAWAIHNAGANTTMLLGRVETVSGNTLTIRTLRDRNGRIVTFDGSTAYKTAQLQNGKVTLTPATQADVKSGSNLLIEASVSQNGTTATAKSVVILPAGNGKALHP